MDVKLLLKRIKELLEIKLLKFNDYLNLWGIPGIDPIDSFRQPDFAFWPLSDANWFSDILILRYEPWIMHKKMLLKPNTTSAVMYEKTLIPFCSLKCHVKKYEWNYLPFFAFLPSGNWVWDFGITADVVLMDKIYWHISKKVVHLILITKFVQTVISLIQMSLNRCL